jgi:hypothetical protein
MCYWSMLPDLVGPCLDDHPALPVDLFRLTYLDYSLIQFCHCVVTGLLFQTP